MRAHNWPGQRACTGYRVQGAGHSAQGSGDSRDRHKHLAVGLVGLLVKEELRGQDAGHVVFVGRVVEHVRQDGQVRAVEGVGVVWRPSQKESPFLVARHIHMMGATIHMARNKVPKEAGGENIDLWQAHSQSFIVFCSKTPPF